MNKPTVSQLLDLLNKPALIKWANKIGLEGIKLDQYLKNKRKSGIDYHKLVENFLKDGVLSNDKDFDDKMISFFKDKKVIDVETKIENDYFTGRFDVKLQWENSNFICDFKTSVKGVYFENKLQLAAYSFQTNYSCAIIKLPDFIIIPVDFDKALYDEFIITLSNLWQLKQKIDFYR
jgi:hypothetical protein